MRSFRTPSVLVACLVAVAWLSGCGGGTGTDAVQADGTGENGSNGGEPTTAEIAYSTGHQYLLAGNYARAVPELRRAVAADPSLRSAWIDLGDALEKQEEYEDAAAAFKEGAHLNGEDLNVLARAAWDYARADAYEDAIFAYEEVLHSDPQFKAALMGLGVIYTEMGETETALGYYEKALEVEPGDPVAIRSLAGHYQEKADELKTKLAAAGSDAAQDSLQAQMMAALSKAAVYYENGVENSTDNSIEFQRQLGNMWYSHKVWDKAVPVYRDLLQTDPENLNYNFSLAVSLDRTGKKAESLEYYRNVLDIDPTQTKIYVLLANAYGDMKQFDKALEIIKRGLANAPDQAAGLNCSWGSLLEAQGNYEEAITKFEKATSDPQWGTYAQKQIERQEKLIKIRELKKEQEAGY
jgi:tetratricopeptide (TPR) repeat protein